ncbi:MAG: hypothetical protein HAW62_02985 [Endozoicomonadaceae bacterium]|nr:hypothetical protein [Endozoicomonadaceae bacterium]
MNSSIYGTSKRIRLQSDSEDTMPAQKAIKLQVASETQASPIFSSQDYHEKMMIRDISDMRIDYPDNISDAIVDQGQLIVSNITEDNIENLSHYLSQIEEYEEQLSGQSSQISTHNRSQLSQLMSTMLFHLFKNKQTSIIRHMFVFLQSTTLFDAQDITNILLNKDHEALFIFCLEQVDLKEVIDLICRKKMNRDQVLLLLLTVESSADNKSKDMIASMMNLIFQLEKEHRILYEFLCTVSIDFIIQNLFFSYQKIDITNQMPQRRLLGLEPAFYTKYLFLDRGDIVTHNIFKLMNLFLSQEEFKAILLKKEALHNSLLNRLCSMYDSEKKLTEDTFFVIFELMENLCTKGPAYNKAYHEAYDDILLEIISHQFGLKILCFSKEKRMPSTLISCMNNKLDASDCYDLIWNNKDEISWYNLLYKQSLDTEPVAIINILKKIDANKCLRLLKSEGKTNSVFLFYLLGQNSKQDLEVVLTFIKEKFNSSECYDLFRIRDRNNKALLENIVSIGWISELYDVFFDFMSQTFTTEECLSFFLENTHDNSKLFYSFFRSSAVPVVCSMLKFINKSNISSFLTFNLLADQNNSEESVIQTFVAAVIRMQPIDYYYENIILMTIYFFNMIAQNLETKECLKLLLLSNQFKTTAFHQLCSFSHMALFDNEIMESSAMMYGFPVSIQQQIFCIIFQFLEKKCTAEECFMLLSNKNSNHDTPFYLLCSQSNTYITGSILKLIANKNMSQENIFELLNYKNKDNHFAFQAIYQTKLLQSSNESQALSGSELGVTLEKAFCCGTSESIDNIDELLSINDDAIVDPQVQTLPVPEETASWSYLKDNFMVLFSMTR